MGKEGEPNSSSGVMATVTLGSRGGASIDAFVEFLQRELDPAKAAIAAYNSPRQLVIAGTTDEIERLMSLLRGPTAPGTASMRLMPGVQCAFHSPLMGEATRQFATQAERLLEAISRPRSLPPHTTVISSVTAQPVAKAFRLPNDPINR